MDDALRVVVEMNEAVWDRLKNALEDLSEEEIHWRPLPQANSINGTDSQRWIHAGGGLGRTDESFATQIRS